MRPRQKHLALAAAACFAAFALALVVETVDRLTREDDVAVQGAGVAAALPAATERRPIAFARAAPQAVTKPSDGAAPADGVESAGPAPEPSADGAVVIEAVTYDADGDVTISGSGRPGEVARLFLDDELEAEVSVGRNGEWRAELARDVAPAVYTLRVDQMTTTGLVTSRAETPFERAPTDLVLREGAVVVQPGNTLWDIADYVYDDGERYVEIYRSNRDQIRDPDLIYPGQVLTLPEADPAIALNPPG